MSSRQVLTTLVVSLALSSIATGQSEVHRDPRLSATTPAPGTVVRPPAAFGVTNYSVTSIAATTFGGSASLDPITTASFGYRYFTGGSKVFISGLSLPSGVVIDYVGVNACDQVGGAFQFSLYDMTSGETSFTVGSVMSSSFGCTTTYNAAPLGYQYPQNIYHSLQIYVGHADGAPIDGEAAVVSVEVWWRRMVSPAPEFVAFNDVPATDPGFQFIAALVDSGITAGCSAAPPLFCPDSPVTRRQFAVFLAKALGLSWSY